MTARFYIALLRRTIFKPALENFPSKDELCKERAKGLANTLTKCLEKAKIAYDSSGFEWKKSVHYLCETAEGTKYVLNGADHSLIKREELENIKLMSKVKREELIGRLNNEVKTASNLAEKERKIAEERAFLTGIANAKAKAKAKDTEEGNKQQRKRKGGVPSFQPVHRKRRKEYQS